MQRDSQGESSRAASPADRACVKKPRDELSWSVSTRSSQAASVFRRQYTPSPSASCRNQCRGRRSPSAAGLGAGRREKLRRVLAHRLEHRRTDGLGTARPPERRGAAFQQDRQSAVGTSTPSPATASSASRVAPPGKAASAANTCRAGRDREPDAPVDGRPQRALPFGEVRRGRRSSEERLAEALRGAFDAEHTQPCGRELDREGQAVERPGNAPYRLHVLLAGGEVGQHLASPLDV